MGSEGKDPSSGADFWSALEDSDLSPIESLSEGPTSTEKAPGPAAGLAAVPPLPGAGRFRLLGRVGSGGMGAVYRVRDRLLLREAALKVLNPSLFTRSKYVRRFLGEAQIQAQLDHPNILPVHEMSNDEQGSYFTMRFVKGRTLSAWIKETQRAGTHAAALTDMLSAVIKICDAVAFAHSRGVIHCDIKPENVIVEDFGAVYLMDWGLARLIGQAATGRSAVAVSPEVWSSLSSTGVMGTPAFMSPEQARGNPEALNERTDVYGIGTLLHAIFIGRAPHPSDDPEEAKARARSEGDVFPVPEKGADGRLLPGSVRHLLERALAPRPERRYASPLELKADLERLIRGGFTFPVLRYPAGHRIVVQGEPGDTAFVIEEGTCTAYKDGRGARTILRTMGPGEVFGETAVFSPGPRTATVEASTEVLLRVLTRQSLSDGLGLGSLVGAFVVALADRFRELDAKLAALGADAPDEKKGGPGEPSPP